MKKILILLLLASLGLLVVCSKCKADERSTDIYFVEISRESYGSIVYDSRTGVEY